MITAVVVITVQKLLAYAPMYYASMYYKTMQGTGKIGSLQCTENNKHLIHTGHRLFHPTTRRRVDQIVQLARIIRYALGVYAARRTNFPNTIHTIHVFKLLNIDSTHHDKCGISLAAKWYRFQCLNTQSSRVKLTDTKHKIQVSHVFRTHSSQWFSRAQQHS